MKEALLKAYNYITDNTILCFRIILFLVFLGHGLVSLGYSPNYQLHYQVFTSVNFFNLDIAKFLIYQGSLDIVLSFLVLFGLWPRIVLTFALVYLSVVALAAYWFYHFTTGSFWGIAETFRRFAWIFYAIFLWFAAVRNEKRFALLRIGIGFAFLAHGLASLGYFGLKGGHIELAKQVLSEDTATKIVYYSGFSDTFIGTMLVFGVLSKPLSIIGSFWLVFVVYLSILLAFPDAIFRAGFLLSCIYVALDKRCHTFIWKKGIIEPIT